jgi:hypothetical protein
MGTDEPRMATAVPAAEAAQPTLDLEGLDSERAGSRAVFQAGFDGWLAFPDVVSDTNPDLADVMVAGAYVARATLKERIPSLVYCLRMRSRRRERTPVLPRRLNPPTDATDATAIS